MCNKTLELIIEGNLTNNEKYLINKFCKIKYSLPSINSYVIEIEEKNLNEIKNLKNLNKIHKNTYITTQMFNARKTINAEQSEKNGFDGSGVTIAILDTGISPVDDLTKPNNRIIAFKDFVNNKKTPYDDNGHGTHVAGIAGGNGYCSNGKYKGVAPNCNFVSVKVLDSDGKGSSSDVLAGLQWIIDNKEKYKIKILNLSIGTTSTSLKDPLIKAVEKVWDSNIVVTIAAGNNGPSKRSITSPAVSKKIITIGASDDNKPTLIEGSTLVNFSGRGPTLECVVKPDVVAPGVSIVSCLSSSLLSKKDGIIDDKYFALSGTSMSTPMVSGAVSLLLQKFPSLKPDDVKLMLKKSCSDLNLPKNQQGWGLINIKNLLSMEVCYARK